MAGLLAPLLVGVGLLVTGAAAAAAKKKKAGAVPGGAADTSEVGRVFAQAMDPTMRDLEWMRQAVAFLRSKGATDKAGQVSARIAALQANAANEAAARQRAEQAKAEWEAAHGGPATPAQLEAVWTQVQSGEIDNNKALLVFAFTLFTAYGMPERAAFTQQKIDRLDGIVSIQPTPAGGGAAAPPTGGGEPAEPPTVVVDEQAGTVTTTPPEARPGTTPEGPEDEIFPEIVTRTPGVGPGIPGAEPTQPGEQPGELPGREVQPVVDPNGTIALCRMLIAAEARSDWKTALKSAVMAWQQKVGLKGDGLFGPKSALRMAQEVGVLPRIRYWSRTGGTLAQQLTKFRDDLYTLAANLEQQGKREHAAALRVSGDKETGQGWPRTPAAVPAEERAEEALDIVAAVQQAAGESLADLRADFPWLRELTPS